MLSAKLGQFKTLKNNSISAVLLADSNELAKIVELVTACQSGNILQLSARIVKPKPIKKDAKKKPDLKKAKGPRRVRRYPYRD